MKVGKLGQLVEELLLGVQPFLSTLHERRVPQRQAEDNYASMGIGLVASSHLIAQFRDPRRNGACSATMTQVLPKLDPMPHPATVESNIIYLRVGQGVAPGDAALVATPSPATDFHEAAFA